MPAGRHQTTGRYVKTAFELKRDLEKFSKKIDEDIDLVVRTVALDLIRRIINKTPVLTGRAAGSWAASAMSAGTFMVPKGTRSSASEALLRAKSAIDSLPAGTRKIVIYNNVEYIVPLEYGHSMQAPHGMVRVALAEEATYMDSVLQRLFGK